MGSRGHCTHRLTGCRSLRTTAGVCRAFATQSFPQSYVHPVGGRETQKAHWCGQGHQGHSWQAVALGFEPGPSGPEALLSPAACAEPCADSGGS